MPPSMRRLALALVAVAGALSLAPAAFASPAIRYGIQDDGWLTSGPGTLADRLDRLQSLGVDVVRFDLHWNEIAVSPDPTTWRWDTPDAVLSGLRTRGIVPVLTLLGTPSWANGGRAPNWAPSSGASFAAFARAAASRYSWVRDWTIWNEPNTPIELRPTAASTYVRLLLNPAYAAIHSVDHAAIVAGGMTAPRANRTGIAPIAWLRAMHAAHAQFDVYAHHPYPGSPHETPFAGGCHSCTSITMANLPVLLRELQREYPGKHVWLTEYGYQTNPPDPFVGVSLPRQAAFVGLSALRAYELPRVDMLIHYIFQDDSQVGGWQSGLVTAGGEAKPALEAFAEPLAEVSRHGRDVVVWGQVRPGVGSQPYRLERLVGGTWRSVGPTGRTSPRGFFTRTLVAARGTYLRVTSPYGTGAAIPLS
jgi:hypothetical protein